MHWRLGDSYLQLPDYIPVLSNVQALVFPTTLYADRPKSSVWREMPSAVLSSWYSIEPYPLESSMTGSESLSRAVTPITEWECPYIYLYGGYTPSGTLNKKIFRGVINRLSFKPLQ